MREWFLDITLFGHEVIVSDDNAMGFEEWVEGVRDETSDFVIRKWYNGKVVEESMVYSTFDAALHHLIDAHSRNKDVEGVGHSIKEIYHER